MKYTLLVVFADETRMPEEPMGDYIEFENLREFIDFNLEQIEMIKDHAPEYERVAQKLQNYSYSTKLISPNSIRVTVRDI